MKENWVVVTGDIEGYVGLYNDLTSMRIIRQLSVYLLKRSVSEPSFMAKPGKSLSGELSALN